MSGNLDPETVAGFGEEWSAYDQTGIPAAEREAFFNAYFRIFPFEALPPNAEGFDLGCGSGRWAAMVAPKVGTLHCIDPAERALEVARKNVPGALFHLAGADNIPLDDNSQDFGYSLGVLHHIPDTQAALANCVRKLKPGAPFLVYLYYALENRPAYYRAIWRVSDILRRAICRLPFGLKKTVTTGLAATVYFPLSRAARIFGPDFPLYSYRCDSFYTLRTDALDRFGTRLEKRFTKDAIHQMMDKAGLTRIRFSDQLPYWTAVGFKAA